MRRGSLAVSSCSRYIYSFTHPPPLFQHQKKVREKKKNVRRSEVLFQRDIHAARHFQEHPVPAHLFGQLLRILIPLHGRGLPEPGGRLAGWCGIVAGVELCHPCHRRCSNRSLERRQGQLPCRACQHCESSDRQLKLVWEKFSSRGFTQTSTSPV